MKKVISIILTITVLLSMIITAIFSTLAEASPIKVTHIDITQTPNFATTGSTTATTAKVEDNLLKIHVQNWERQLINNTPSSSQTWFPNYLVKNNNGEIFSFTEGSKVIVEVNYKVTGNPNANHGTQIGVGAWYASGGSNMFTQACRKHMAEDKDKEFTLSASYVINSSNKKGVKIAFSGGGDLEISGITIYELPKENINDYAVVKYVDGDKENTEFVKKNTSPKTLLGGEYDFDGWYASPSFTGEKITKINSDTILYAKWEGIEEDTPVKTTHVDITKTPNFATTGSTTATTAKVEDNLLKIHVQNWERQLINNTPSSSQTWFPNYLIGTDDGGVFAFSEGSKVIVEFEYKITGTPNSTHGLQVGVGAWYASSGSNMFTKAYKQHMPEDNGKNFTFATSYAIDASNKKGVKIAFSGGGDLEISSITLHELPKEYINDYVIVKYVDSGKEHTEFVKKNAGLKKPKSDDLEFEGWYSNSSFEGDKITKVSSNTTLYAKWSAGAGKVFVTYNDSIGNGSKTVKHSVGDHIDNVPVANGYNFLGWYKYSNYVGRAIESITDDIGNLYAKWEDANPDTAMYVDLTQTPKVVTTSATVDTNAKVSGNKLIVNVKNYERKLQNTNSSADTWFPAYYFKNSNGEDIKLTTGETYELEVNYKVVDVEGDDYGLAIAFGTDYQVANRTKVKGYKFHKTADEGKEFTFNVSYVVDKNIYPKLLFSGQGKLEITSIIIKKKLPIVKDTVIGVQTYEDYDVGTKSGVSGDARGIEVSNEVNHTAKNGSKKSLKLSLNSNISRLSGNTIIALNTDGKLKNFSGQVGSAYCVTFWVYGKSNMEDLIWTVNSVDEALKNNYLQYYNNEARGKVSINKGQWKKVTAYISNFKGGNVSGKNLIAIGIASNGYDGKYVYIDDVEIKQLVDSDVILYDTNGGTELEPSRAFAGEKIQSLKEPSKDGYLFDGWYYDKGLDKIAEIGDKFPSDKMEIKLYAKWIESPATATEFTAGSFDKKIYDKTVPYKNKLSDVDGDVYFTDSMTTTHSAAWVEDAGIFGNGSSELDGALLFNNEFYSSLNDIAGYNAIKLMNSDGTPFVVVKGEKYTLKFDYIFASNRGISYIVPIVSEKSMYSNIGYNSYQTLKRVSVQDTDTDYQSYEQAFIADRTGFVYIAVTGRDDNANVDTHCYEKVCVDNVKIKLNNKVVKLQIKSGNSIIKTLYGIKGEKAEIPNVLSDDTSTAYGVYTDSAFTNIFDGYFPDKDSTVYVKTGKGDYTVPSDFSKPIKLDFEQKDVLKTLYQQSKYMTSWSRETENEWIYVTDEKQNAFDGNSYIKLNGFNHYWNQAKFALYDTNHPENIMLLPKGEKYRVTVMARCEDEYETPVNMTVCLENPNKRHLLEENGNVKLTYNPSGDKNGYYMFVGDIEVSSDMNYLPMLAIRRNANDLQSLFIDNVTVEKLVDLTVKFESNGGTVFEDAVLQIHDNVYDPGTPFKDGFDFDGWYTSNDFAKKWDFDNDTLEENMTLYAKWKPVTEENNTVEKDDKPLVLDETKTTKKKPDNGKSPELLDADKAVVANENGNSVASEENSEKPVWLIVLIVAGSILLLGATTLLVIIFAKNKKSKNKENA